MRRVLVCVVLLGLVAAACSSKSSGTPAATSNTVARPSSTAKLSILEPKSGAVLSTSTVVVQLTLVGGTITKVVSTHIQPNVGHIHIRLDGRTITLLGSLTDPVPVTPGPHIVEAEFVASDHGPFSPRVLSAVSFTVK